MDAGQASQVLQQLQFLEHAATGQLNARRGAERALVEAQTRITQLDQALQQGGRPGTTAGQVVDTRVLGRPDKWDGSEKAWPNWSFVMEVCAGAIDQALSADMTTAECSTDVMSIDTMTGEKKARSVQLYFVLIMLCTGRALDRIANAPNGWGGGVANALSSVLSKEHCKACCDDARSVGVSFGHKRCGEQSGNDGPEILEFERYANIEISEFLKIGIVIRRAAKGPMRTHLIMNWHRLATFQEIKTEVTNVKQAKSAVKARSGDAMDVDAFTKGPKCASKGSGKKQDSEVVCWYCEKEGHRASDCRKKQRDNDSGKSKGSKKGDSNGKSNKEKTHRQMLQVWQDRSHVKGLQIQRNECIRSWRRVGRDRMYRHGKRRFERSGDWSSAVAGKGSQNSYWNRFVCCSDCVSQECCGRLSDVRHGQAKRRVTDQRQASFFQIWVREKSMSNSETGLSDT